MSDSTINLLLGIAGVVILAMLIYRRRSNAAKTSTVKKPTIGRTAIGRGR
jgi:hypothetical protein